ncbi:hypothetical protein GGR28_000321 [Lewinella aquimaris]|uniref:Uncharacterized protein n=1 Tax=Neolewinella aquimaris TaxID=1835722 RepID=A0A840DXQ8_9BACT|nr:hypothetical protein [Neolewinella aquimaris]MBB4077720.1 hypothetical protein [Neolewinella aquimaris]
MSYITLKNDRKRRRQARVVTFIVTVSMLSAAAYGMGATQELADFFQQLIATAPAAEPVA